MNQKMKKTLLTAVILTICALLFCVKLTGGIIHFILGMALVCVSTGHMLKNKERLSYVKRSLKCVNYLLLSAMGVMLITGILMHPFSEILAIKILHKMSSLLFICGCLIHANQHKCKKTV